MTPAPANAPRVVILGTGGTIAGQAPEGTDNLGYRSASLDVEQLVRAVPALAAFALACEQVAQVDSKDMEPAIWGALARRAAYHLARPEVGGVVITHGTDTLEETAWFLHRVLAPVKPLVLTAAMRPATSLQADGPQNLLDAVTVACARGARGVLAALGGEVLAGCDLRKVHGYRVAAFSAGDAGPVARLEEGHLRRLRPWPEGVPLGLSRLPVDPAARWPWVEILTSHAGARAVAVQALVAAGVQGLVVAGTGNGTVHTQWEEALAAAQAAGVPVWRTSRCLLGGVVDTAGASHADPQALPVAAEACSDAGKATGATLPHASALTPPQASVELMLRLLTP